MNRSQYRIVIAGALLLIGLLSFAIWLLPLSGQVVVSADTSMASRPDPEFFVSPAEPQSGELTTFTVTAVHPWAHVKLMVNGQAANFSDWETQALPPQTTWTWTHQLPSQNLSHMEIAFYSDCDTGCQLRGRTYLHGSSSVQANESAPQALQPTKLCTVFPNSERDWHGQSGLVVDLTYARWADSEEDPYWTVDALAGRVHEAMQQGLRVLVRVDYDKGQTLPPAEDLLGLEEYLAYVRRLARDERLRDVYGYIVGSGYNAIDSSSLAPGQPITPAWYARLFNGYGEPVVRQDNVVQTIRAENSLVRVLVGPIRPWIADQSGDVAYDIDVPWLSYMNTVVVLLTESATVKAMGGDARALPDGFALNAPGRVDAAELGDDVALEPQTNLRRAEWDGAQAGFRVYQDFLAVINSFPATRGLPAYISTTNTFTPDAGVLPAQNYPSGWLVNALAEINAEPQIQSLCWFLDLVPGDNQWDAFSLTRQPANMQDASEEFDALLRGEGLEEGS